LCFQLIIFYIKVKELSLQRIKGMDIEARTSTQQRNDTIFQLKRVRETDLKKVLELGEKIKR
jgi:hypothetical protein